MLAEMKEQMNSGTRQLDIDFKSGKISLKGINVQKRISFLDYIFGGCEIGVHVAIDYTLSNGDPNNQNSLHHLDQYNYPQRNQYTDAISAVCNILQDYDADQIFPVYGFGGMLPNTPDGKASHCFALNGDIF